MTTIRTQYKVARVEGDDLESLLNNNAAEGWYYRDMKPVVPGIFWVVLERQAEEQPADPTARSPIGGGAMACRG